MRKSFSIAEVIVVISIVGLITAVSIYAILNLHRQQDVKSVAQNIANQILLARSTAMAPPDNIISPVKVKVGFFSDRTMRTAIQYNGTNVTPDSTVLTLPTNLNWSSLNSNMTYSTTPSPPHYWFSFVATSDKLGQTIDNGSSGGDPTLCVQSTDTPIKYFIIEVNKLTGKVEVNGVTSCP